MRNKVKSTTLIKLSFRIYSYNGSNNVIVYLVSVKPCWKEFNLLLRCWKGRAIAQAVSRWLPTAAARVRSRVWLSGICGGQSGAGAGFLRVLRFSLAIFNSPIAPQSPSPIIWGWYNRAEVAAVPCGLSLTPPSNKKKVGKMTDKFKYRKIQNFNTPVVTNRLCCLS
jgi:hypothetical protein